jgi:peptidoglycan hydrolase CwlO-like protein
MKESTMDEDTGITGWVLAGMATIVSTLAGLVAMFYRQQIADYKDNEIKIETAHKVTEDHLSKELEELKTRADSCENDREELRIELAVLKTRISVIEKKIDN